MITLGELAGLRSPLPCEGKTQHPSRGKAEAALRSLLRKHDVKEPETLNVYLCMHCKAWHTGHNRLVIRQREARAIEVPTVVRPVENAGPDNAVRYPFRRHPRK